MRIDFKYKPQNLHLFKLKLLHWANSFEPILWLDSNNYTDAFSKYEGILAVGKSSEYIPKQNKGFTGLSTYREEVNDWVFGYFSYDLKNELEPLKSSNKDELNWPELYFFQPKYLFLFKKNEVVISFLKTDEDQWMEEWAIINSLILTNISSTASPIKISMRMKKEIYIDRVKQILKNIQRGNVYEVNFCQEFYSYNAEINPLQVFQKLREISKPPFGAYFKLHQNYLICSSPERFLQKQGQQILAQPIKGTAKRSENPIEDLKFKRELKSDEKERSENIMIVDLLRNDLSKLALPSSVRVEELCEVYPFEQVYQMISTITAKVAPHTDPIKIIANSFPMGSMTGAPKIAAMKIIENMEVSKRGLYSGALGYIDPNGNFDFNVVIRSILYNSQKKYVSYTVGSAITAKSNPTKEYEECMLKAKALRKVLRQN